MDTSTKDTFERWLRILVETPSISAEPNHANDIAAAAVTAKEILTEAGLTARVIETAGNPVVFGQTAHNPDWPTVLLYNHLDVQPADPTEWKTDPFALVVHDDIYYGRGTTDDKGPALTALMAITQTIRHKVPINFKVVWELEEEIGSPHFAGFAEANKDMLAADVVLVSDTVWLSKDKPTLVYGLRGLITFEVTLTTAAKDVHSGLAGGVARNPVAELCQLISQLHDARTGRVLVPGFYDGVQQPSATELDWLEEAGFSAEAFKQAHELDSLRFTDDQEIAKHIMLEPTFEVHGITGGYTGDGVKTTIPHTATAKLSCRLVPGQNPQAIFAKLQSRIAALCPDAQIILVAAAAPYHCNPSSPAADTFVTTCQSVLGKQPAFIREGGSIGAVLALDAVTGAPVIMFGLSLPEHGYHAPNEHYDWQQAHRGIRLFSEYFASLASSQEPTSQA